MSTKKLTLIGKEAIKKAEYFSVDWDYCDEVINHSVEIMSVDSLKNFVRATLTDRAIRSKRAFRNMCIKYEDSWK